MDRKRKGREGIWFDHQTAQPSPYRLRVEIDEQRRWQARQAEIGEYLRLVEGLQALDGLYLHDETVFYDEVQPVAALQLNSLVGDRHGLLPLENKPAKRKLVREAFLIRRFEQAGAKRAMHFDARADHAV